MSTGIPSLIETGTRVWLDSVDPQYTGTSHDWGVTGATSNPIIIADIIRAGQLDQRITELFEQGRDDEQVVWALTDELVSAAQDVFRDTYEQTGGDDGYVSFELDPLLEDPQQGPSHEQRVARYVELGKYWSSGQDNRLIKVPATEAGLEALEPLAAAGVPLNVTLIFSQRQYEQARDAVWRGAQQRADGLGKFKSVYSIFISRVDVYTKKHVPELSDEAQGMVGLVNVKRMWRANEPFWQDRGTPLHQQIVFASTGKKLDWQSEDYYVEHLAGGGILTNPPGTNEAIQKLGKSYRKTVDQLPDQKVLDEIDEKVSTEHLERTLMEEGVAKFADPHKELLKLVAEKRQALAGTG